MLKKAFSNSPSAPNPKGIYIFILFLCKYVLNPYVSVVIRYFYSINFMHNALYIASYIFLILYSLISNCSVIQIVLNLLFFLTLFEIIIYDMLLSFKYPFNVLIPSVLAFNPYSLKAFFNLF